MATLERIRSKSVFLIVIIGVALLAFIVGDALTNSRNLFGDHTTVAKIGDEKIDYHDYLNKREELSRRLEAARLQNPAQYANFDTQLLSQMAIDELTGTTLLDNAVSDAGIRTSPSQLRFYVMENPVNQEDLRTIITQLNQTGISVATPAQAYEVIFNPERNGMTKAQVEPFQRAWVAMEQKTAQMVGRNTYQRLLYGTIKANDLDKKALYDDYVSTRQMRMAYHPYGQLDEKEYPVSDAEIKAAYDAAKNEFRVDEPTKDISFIAVSIAPSAQDRQDAQRIADATMAALNDSTGAVPQSLRKEGVMTERKHMRLSDLPNGAVRTYLASARRDSAKMVTNNLRGFTAIRMTDRSMEVDSIQLNIIQVAGATLPGRVMARLNAGLSADSLASVFGQDSVMVQTEQWLPLYAKEGPTNALQAAQLDSLRAAQGRYVSLMSTPQGAVLAKIVRQSSPVEIVEYDEVTYALNPSTKTVNEERAKLEKFLLDNNTPAKMAENAAKAGYTLQNYQLTASSPAVPRVAGYNQYYPESRQVVRWVMMDGKPGQVSQVYESKDASAPTLYVAAVNSEFEDFIPVSDKQVRDALTLRVRRDKAGDALVKKYQGAGNTIEAVATAMNVEPREIPTFRFGRGSGVNDPKAMGRMAGSKADGRLTVIKGDNGVYAYQINGASTEAFPFNDAQYEQQYFQMVSPQLDVMLRGAKKLKNNAYKFEAGE